MNQFVKECLMPILNNDISDDIVDYICSINNEEDFQEFMDNIVDRSNPKHVEVFNMLRNAQFGNTKKPNKKNRNKQQQGQMSLPNQQVQEKFPNQQHRKSEQPQRVVASSSAPSNSAPQQQPERKQGKKKFVNFYSYADKPGLKKGRHPCECQATRHVLIGNCTSCGRIVCEQEGSGSCLFCDAMVVTREERELLDSKTKESDRLYNHLMEKKKSKDWERAIETRNRLLKTDQLGVIKNKIYDDQNDYFGANEAWMDETELSEKAQYLQYHERLHRSRNDMKLALDFASRTVTVGDEDDKYKKSLMKGVNKLLDSTDKRFPKNLFSGDRGELISQIVQLMETEKSKHVTSTTSNRMKDDTVNALVAPNQYRIANKDFSDSVDKGMCLSMHQPWASLLVAGIKIHEGRTWRTEHRGRLWIAAAAKEPEDEEILACEETYRILYNDSSIAFPKSYPQACLLGCVFVEDCLDQLTYRKRFPNGESESPFVLICSNPVILPIFYPMQGQHKIFALDKDLHKSAKCALLSSKWV